MPNLIKIKQNYLKYKKTINIILILILLPVGLTILDLVLHFIFNLGIYIGTFLRYLYNIVVY